MGPCKLIHRVEVHIGKHEKCCLNDGDAVSIHKCQFYFLLPLHGMPDENTSTNTNEHSLDIIPDRLSLKRDEPEIVDLTKRQETES